MTFSLIFTVEGHPAPQGSKRHVGNGRMIEASKRLHPWRDLVIAKVRENAELIEQFNQPIRVSLEFRIPRPQKPKHELPISRQAGDIDKLSRAILDALTIGGLIMDDSLVVHLTASKRYTPTLPGVTIKISEIDDVQ